MSSGTIVYCDEASDELLAEQWLSGPDGLGVPKIVRLPTLSHSPPTLRPILEWERQDWVVADDERVICTVEFSRHGYTGDNGFQRFARLYRAAALGIPNIYFTPFSRSRLNELDDGFANERNVAPELFQTLFRMSARYSTPCIALAWPTDDEGTPLPLTTAPARSALSVLRSLINYFVSNPSPGSNVELGDDFPDVIAAMQAQSDLGFRGSETRGVFDLPSDLLSSEWVRSFLPSAYFGYGKADKALASMALRAVEDRPLSPPSSLPHFWEHEGKARVLYLGYQWRPDPACGLIALTAAQQQTGEHLAVVWPRVFLSDGPARSSVVDALSQFKKSGDGLLHQELVSLGFDDASVERFRKRVSVSGNQFGLYSAASKVGRILRDTKALAVFGDGAVLHE